jgi:hypothetical protein
MPLAWELTIHMSPSIRVTFISCINFSVLIIMQKGEHSGLGFDSANCRSILCVRYNQNPGLIAHNQLFLAMLKSIFTAGQLGNSTILTQFLTPSWIEKVLQMHSRDTSTIQDGVATGKSVDAMSSHDWLSHS